MTITRVSFGRVVSELFQQLPSRRAYPDYYEVIKLPMALNNIKANENNSYLFVSNPASRKLKAKIDASEYTSLEEFRADCDLMFANAKKYNVQYSEVYNDA
ncbi:Bromodomain-containing protein, partial [Endogone sp. FLAS-F59071]